jgi:hypothetical protein
MSGYLRGLVLRAIDADSMVEPLLGAPLVSAAYIRTLDAEVPPQDGRDLPHGDAPSPVEGENAARTVAEGRATRHDPDPKGAREIRAPRSDPLRTLTVRPEGEEKPGPGGRAIAAPPEAERAQAGREHPHPDSQHQTEEGNAKPTRRTGIALHDAPAPEGGIEVHITRLPSLPRGPREMRGAIEPPTLTRSNTRDGKPASGSVSPPMGRQVGRAGFGVEPLAGRRPVSESSADDGGTSQPAGPPPEELVGPPRSHLPPADRAPSRPPPNSAPGRVPVFPEQPAASPTIEVTIGRIEVRGGTPPARPARPRWSPTPMTLADYLDRRARKDRG